MEGCPFSLFLLAVWRIVVSFPKVEDMADYFNLHTGYVVRKIRRNVAVNQSRKVGTHLPYFIEGHVRKTLLRNDQDVSAYFDALNLYSHEPNYIGAVYHAKPFVFLPCRLVNSIEADTNAYKKFGYDEQLPYYVIQTDLPKVSKVTYILRKATRNDIPFYFRPMANRMARYTQSSIEVAPNLYKLVYINGHHYVLVARNDVIDNRIVDIKVE